MESTLITPEEVLESLMNDGTIDALRLKIINQLKANEELKKNTLTMVEQSKVLNTPGAEKQTKRELFDALRQELETPVLEKASKSVWDLILDNDGLGREITETVEKIFCRLSGRDPPLFLPNTEALPEKEKEKKDLDKEKGKRDFGSSSKKRKMKLRGESGELADGIGGSPAIPKDSVMKLRKKSVHHDKSMESERGSRCKRTDGKNWRCSRDIVPNQKYCERHMYRTSKSRSRKPLETTSPAITSPIVIKESNTDLSVSVPPQLPNTMTNNDSSVSPKGASSPKRARTSIICRTESS